MEETIHGGSPSLIETWDYWGSVTMTKGKEKKEKEGEETQPSRSGTCLWEAQSGGRGMFGAHIIKLDEKSTSTSIWPGYHHYTVSGF